MPKWHPAKSDKQQRCAGKPLGRQQQAVGCRKRRGLESENRKFKTTSKEAGKAMVKDTGSIEEEKEDPVPGF